MQLKNCWITASVFALFTSLWMILPGSHLVMDEGYRLLQASALHEKLSFPVLIDYPGEDALGNLAGDLRPMPAHYGSFTEGKLHCFYSPTLALLASPFTGRGMLLVPMLSGFLLWLTLWQTLKKSGFSTVHAALIPLFCTPVLFYSMRFWSYPLSILLAILAVYKAEKGKPCIAYLLVALAALFRIEFLVAVIPVFFRLPGKWYKKLLPGIPAILFLLAGNWLFSGGSVLGSHLAASATEQGMYGSEDISLVQQKWKAAQTALFSMVPGETGIISLIPGILLWILWGISIWKSRSSFALSLIALTLSLAACVLWALGKYSFLDGFSMKHPLMVFPILWLFSKETLKDSIPEIAVFVILLLMLLPMHTQGPDWGVRHLFLPIFLMIRKLKPLGESKKLAPILVLALLITSSSLLFLGINRGRVEKLSTLADGRAVIATNWIIPGWFTDNMTEGTPVVYAGTAGLMAEALFKLQDTESGTSPVVVCLHRDAGRTIQILEELGFNSTVGGEVAFGPSLKCLVLILR